MVALPITLDGAIEWEFERTKKHRISPRNRQFLVFFVGFDMSEAVWLSEDDLGNAQQLLMKYKQSHGLAQWFALLS